MSSINIFNSEWRNQTFPIFQSMDKGWCYLDSANTTLKPFPVIESINNYYKNLSGNVHRGSYQLSNKVTELFELSRQRVQKFIHAKKPEEIIFVRGTTEGINLVAHSWGKSFLKPGQRILLTRMEHHANIVPWQIVAEQTGVLIDVVEILENGELDLSDLKKKLNSQTALVAVTACSNSLGTINPIEQIIELAHQAGAKVLVDGAQWVSEQRTDVQKWNVDFFVFSGHKIFGPTGVGVLYGKSELLEAMPPYQSGGSMISKVTFEKTTYHNLPYKFEAGTPAVAEVIALKSALDFVDEIGLERIHQHKLNLLALLNHEFSKHSDITIYGNSPQKSSIVSFNLQGAHSSDVADILDNEKLCLRSGHHCNQPLLQFFGVNSTLRASLSLYNQEEEVYILIKALDKARGMLL